MKYIHQIFLTFWNILMDKSRYKMQANNDDSLKELINNSRHPELNNLGK